MHLSGILGFLIGGLFIGALGRLVLPGRHPIGCLLTIVIGVVGAGIGYYLGNTTWKLGDWPTFFLQVLVAAVLVGVFSAFSRNRRPPA